MIFLLEKNNLKKAFFGVLLVLYAIIPLHGSTLLWPVFQKGVFQGIKEKKINEYWIYCNCNMNRNCSITSLTKGDYKWIIIQIKELESISSDNIKELRKLLAIASTHPLDSYLEEIMDLFDDSMDQKLSDDLKNKRVIQHVFEAPTVPTEYSFLAYFFELYYLKIIRTEAKFSYDQEYCRRTDKDNFLDICWKNLYFKSQEKNFVIDIDSRAFALCCRFGNKPLVEQFLAYGDQLHQNKENYWLNEMIQHKTGNDTYFTTFFQEYFSIRIGGVPNDNRNSGSGIDNDAIEELLIKRASIKRASENRLRAIDIFQKNTIPKEVKNIGLIPLTARFHRNSNGWHRWILCLESYYDKDCKKVLDDINKKNNKNYTLQTMNNIELLSESETEENKKLKFEYITNLRKEPTLTYLNTSLPKSEMDFEQYDLIKAILTSEDPKKTHFSSMTKSASEIIYNQLKEFLPKFRGIIVKQEHIDYVQSQLKDENGQMLVQLLSKQVEIHRKITKLQDPQKYSTKIMKAETEQAMYQRKVIELEKKYKSKVQSLEKDNEVYQENQKLESENSKLKLKLKELNTENTKLKGDLEIKGNQIKEYIDTICKIENVNKKIIETVNQVRNIRQYSNTADQVLNDKKDFSFENKDTTIIDLKSKNEELNKKVKNMENELSKLKQSLMMKENEVKEIKEEMQKKQESIEEMVEEKKNLEEKVKFLTQSGVQNDKKVNEQLKMIDLQSKNNNLDKKVKKMENEMSNLKEAKSSIENELNTLKVAKGNLENELNMLKNTPLGQEGNQGDLSSQIDRIKSEKKQLENTFFKLKIYSIVSSIIIFAMGSFAFFEYLKRKKNGSAPSTTDE